MKSKSLISLLLSVFILQSSLVFGTGGTPSTVSSDCGAFLQTWAVNYPELESYYVKAKALQSQADPSHPFLTLVIPAYREAKRIEKSIAQFKTFFDRYPFNVEIMVRIEKSPDDTVAVTNMAVADDPRFTVYDHGIQRGKGYAVRQGMLDSKGDYVIFMDTDLSTPLPEIYHFLAAVADGATADVIIGNRYNATSTVEDKSLPRRVMSATFQGVIGTVLGAYGLRGIEDTQCGFKMFNRRATDALFPQATINGFAFDVELLLMAARLGLSIGQIPVQWKDAENSTVNPLVDPFKMLWDVQKMARQVRQRELTPVSGP